MTVKSATNPWLLIIERNLKKKWSFCHSTLDSTGILALGLQNYNNVHPSFNN